ncbi:MAG: CheR family methyltransferase [Actinomycetota bacterium]|nr:CheR family methyltransferase [Actinomycetota bacterium]
MSEPDDSLERLLTFIADTRAIDFSGYKRTSLERRFRKRMADTSAQTFDDYRDLLETNSEEYRFLLDTVLINVTSFFRDPAAWEHLGTQVIPDLVDQVGDGEIRVWSAGCSTGEEACSLAIAFAEVMGVEAFSRQVKIYATDIDDDALRQARLGVYSAKGLEPLSAELVERYFEPTGSSYVLRPELRRRVIYGRHDITRDAPISRLHLLSCRNVLMYFNAETQNQILDRFHFALGEEGVLFLGKAEMLLSDGERFEALSMPNRIFRRRPGARTYRPIHSPVVLEVARATGGNLRQRQLRDLAIETAPSAHVLVDVNGVVTLINNQARAMFGLSSREEGRPLRDLEVSYRPVELRSLIDQAQSERRLVRRNAIERALGDESRFLDVLVQPLISDDGIVLGVDIVFSDTTDYVRLQEDVRRSREDLETAYEELQSTNEELETTNEELQSTNEELETTNEELQSTNEELETMNEELRTRTQELDETGTFLEATLASVPDGVVVLDDALRVRAWNRSAENLWGLRSSEAEGVSFFALDIGLPTGQLREPIRRCFDEGVSARVELAAVNRLGRNITCAVAVSPLGTDRDGVVVTMEDLASS